MAERRSEASQISGITFAEITPKAAADLAEAFAEIDPWARYAYNASTLATYLSAYEADAPRFAIVAGDETAGAIGVRGNWLRGPYVQFLGILPAFQHRGVGSSALAWVEGEARNEGAQNLWVAASEFNARALAFYERHEFRRVATLDGLIADGISEILLRKRLNGV
jgi:ribosomal protein S18 acetylase RimI-like enzyme